MSETPRERLVRELASQLGGIDPHSANDLLDPLLDRIIQRGTTTEGVVKLISILTPLKPRHDSQLARAAQIAQQAKTDPQARECLLQEAWKKANPLWRT